VADRGVRLLWTDANGAEHLRDFASISEAREHVADDMSDWVIVERTISGVYGVVGRVLDLVGGHVDCDCSSCLPPTY
jgi:hypothetical protein